MRCMWPQICCLFFSAASIESIHPPCIPSLNISSMIHFSKERLSSSAYRTPGRQPIYGLPLTQSIIDKKPPGKQFGGARDF
ncbi:hypothetical protein BDV59DRAFT_171265 [Aspergillus ambiguus]|uniref:uncharacterized protein n=1 Tax=Aspergillus ambiguus TaxID=176160 RepID=UPI003CCDBB84